MTFLARYLVSLLAVAAIGFGLFQVSFAARIWWWRDHTPSTTAFIEMRRPGMEARDRELRHQWIDYERISDNLKRAIIVAEDGKFLDHEGFDWDGIQHALEKNQKRGRMVAGGSTITQQLAKNLFLTGERSMARKAQEAIITLMLETLLDKQRILEIYLNVIEWGDGVFGAEAAARHYFGASAGRLSVEQAARLAAMVPRPRFYDRNRGSAALARKTALILARMRGADLP